MTRSGSARRPRTTPVEVATHLGPSGPETDPTEVERFAAERADDLRSERRLLIREACIVVVIVVVLASLQVLST